MQDSLEEAGLSQGSTVDSSRWHSHGGAGQQPHISVKRRTRHLRQSQQPWVSPSFPKTISTLLPSFCHGRTPTDTTIFLISFEISFSEGWLWNGTTVYLEFMIPQFLYRTRVDQFPSWWSKWSIFSFAEIQLSLWLLSSATIGLKNQSQYPSGWALLWARKLGCYCCLIMSCSVTWAILKLTIFLPQPSWVLGL